MKKIIGFCMFLVLPMAANSNVITLYNTGVNDDGTPRLEGQKDLHYQLISTPQDVVFDTDFSSNSWISNDSKSAWIDPTPNENGAWIIPTNESDAPSGTYIYRTSFDLTGLDLNTVSIAGRWATDDFGDDIKLNGLSLEFTTSGSGFTHYSDFNITDNFVDGINNLDFVIYNSLGIAGLRVELTGTGDAAVLAEVPVPAAVYLMGTGLVGLLRFKVHKKGACKSSS